MLDHSPSSVARVRRLRKRRRAGQVVLRVEADDHALAHALIASARLCADATADRKAVEAAVADILRNFIQRWANVTR